MSKRFFGDIGPVRFEGPTSDNPYAYRHYDPSRVVMGKTLAEHLRPAVCYWHNFAWMGTDMFGAPTFERPWDGETMKGARAKADVAFDMFSTLGFPFFTFHDRDVVPEGDNLKEFGRNLAEMTDIFAKKMQKSGVKLLWGTANLFSHPRYLAGAATNPDPDVFAYAAAQVKNAIDATHKLDGANYVLWGGREGYETLLNTDLRREQDQLGRFLSLVVEYKHKIGYKGVILVEPKPQEPTKHQYDFDVATVFGFLQRFGLEREVKLNIEVGHAVLAHHSFEHEIALAAALGMLGLDRRQPQRLSVRLGHRPVPQQCGRACAGALFHPEVGRPCAGRFQFRRQGAPAVDRPGRPLARPYRRDRRLRRGAGRGGAHDRGRQVRCAARRALRWLGEAGGAGDAGEGRDAGIDRLAGRQGEDRPRAQVGAAGILREPAEPLFVRLSGTRYAGTSKSVRAFDRGRIVALGLGA